MKSSGKKSKKRFITRGEAVDNPEYESPFSPTPSYAISPNIDAPITRAHTVDYPATLTSSPMSSRSRSEARPGVDLPRRARTFDQPRKDLGEARDRLTELDPRPHSFRPTRRDSTGSEASVRQEQSPLRTDSAASSASVTANPVENYPGRARWHQEDPRSTMSSRTLSSESDGFGSVARKGVGARQSRRDEVATSLLQTPASPIIAHEPTRAKRFIGRPSSRETATIDDGILSSPSRPRASAGWQNTLSNIEDQELVRPQSDLVLVSQSSTESRPDDNLSKAERIAQYKEKRRKELASMFGGVQKAASFDTADMRADGASYLKYRRSSSREDSRTPVEKIPPPVATVSPMVTGTYSTSQSQAQSPSQYPMVTVMSPSSPVKVTADVGTSTSTVGTQTPSPTGLRTTQAQSKAPEEETPPTTRRIRRDRSPLKSIQGAVSLPTIKDEPSADSRASRDVRPRARHLLREGSNTRDSKRVLPLPDAVVNQAAISSSVSDPVLAHKLDSIPDRSRLFSPTTSDSTVSQGTTRTLTPVGHDGTQKDKSRVLPDSVHDKMVSAESDASSTISDRGRQAASGVSKTGRPSSVTLEPLSSLLPPRNVSRPSSTTPLQTQMLDIPQQPPRPASATSKPDHRHIIRPQPIRATTVQRSESSPSKISYRPTEKPDDVKSPSSHSSQSSVSQQQQPTAKNTSATSTIPSASPSVKDPPSSAQSPATSAYTSNTSGLAISSHLSSLLSSTAIPDALDAKLNTQPHSELDSKVPNTAAHPPKSNPTHHGHSSKQHPTAQTSISKHSEETVHILEAHKPVLSKTQPDKSKEYRPLNQPEQQAKLQKSTSQKSQSQKLQKQETLPSKPQIQKQSEPQSQSQIPQTQIPQTQIPQTQMPQPQLQQSQIPQSPIPQSQMPQAQIPQSQIPPSPSPQLLEELDSIESAKPKLRPFFTKEDSFNRPDSPPPQPIPLPKNSVIARNRQKVESSSSSEATPTPSPVMSPRTSRHRGPREPTEALLSPPPRRHNRQGKSRTRSAKKSPGRPLKEEGAKDLPGQRSPGPKGQRSRSPTKQQRKKTDVKEEKPRKEEKEGKKGKDKAKEEKDSKMGQGQSSTTTPSGHGHLQGQGHHVDRSATLPAQSHIGSLVHGIHNQGQGQHNLGQGHKPGPLQSQISQISQSSQQSEEALPTRHIERRMSDSSSATSASRRRYRKRDSSLDTSQMEPVTFRPGKKDKSSARKSSLNSTGQNTTDVGGSRVREHTPISSDDSENKRLSRYDQIQSSRAKSGVAELSLSPPPVPKEEPFPVTQEYVSERLGKSPSPVDVQIHSPIRSKIGDRPRSAISPPPNTTQRDVTSPRRMLSLETNARPLSAPQQPQLLSPGGGSVGGSGGVSGSVGGSVGGSVRSQSQQDYRQLKSPEMRPLSQQSAQVSGDQTYQNISQSSAYPKDRLSSAYKNDEVIQAYSPVIGKTTPLSPVRTTAPATPWSNQGSQQGSGPLSPTVNSPTVLSPTVQSPTIQSQTRSQISPMSPISSPQPVEVSYVPRDRSSALSPGMHGPLSPGPLSPGPLLPGAMSPTMMSPTMTSPTMTSPQPMSPGIVTSANSQVMPHPQRSQAISPQPLSPHPTSPHPLSPTSPQTLSPAISPQSIRPLSPVRGYEPERGPLPRSVTVDTGPRSPVPAPVVFPSPRPLSPQVQDPSKPKFVPYTMDDLEDAYKTSHTKTVEQKPGDNQTQKSAVQAKTVQATVQATTKQPVAQPQPAVVPAKQVAAPQKATTTPQQVVPQKATTANQAAPKSSEPTPFITKETFKEKSSVSTVPKVESQDSKSSDGDTKVEGLINKLHRDRSTESPGREDVLPNLRRGSRDVSELVRRFSSDVSDKEGVPGNRGDSGSPGVLPASLPGATTGLRRTPDRTQSFRQQRQKTPPDSFIRAKSFREKKNGQPDSIADEQLKEILKRRSRNIDEWEEKASLVPDLEKVTEDEAQKFESRFKTVHSPSPVPIDKELSSALQLRREREESGDSQSCSESDSQTKPDRKSAMKSEKVTIKPHKKVTTVEPIKQKVNQPKQGPTSSSTEVKIKTSETKLNVTPVSSSKSSSASDKTSTTPSSEQDTDASSKIEHAKPKVEKVVEKTEIKEVKPEQKIKRLTNETTASIITVAPVVKAAPKDVRNTNVAVVTPPPVIQDKVPERIASTQSLKLKPALTKQDVKSVQRSSRMIELTRSESLQDEGRQKAPLRKTQTFDLGGLEAERAACNLPQNVVPVRRRSVHSPTPEQEPQGAEADAKKISVAERIFQMEVKDDGYTPRSGTSGAMTPRLIKLRSSGPSGTASPRRNTEAPPMTLTSTPEKVVSDQLMAKLGDMAVLQEAGVRRREGSQKTQKDPRRRTQPVTLEEVQEASALESVSAFREEISKNTLINEFKKTKPSHTIFKEKGQETFPQPFNRQRLKDRRKDKRYQTQPITTEELGDVPEMQPITIPERPKKRTVYDLNLTSDSDIELDHLVQVNYNKLQGQSANQRNGNSSNQSNQSNQSDTNKSDTTDKDTETAQDEFSKLSVSQKMNLFRKMEDRKPSAQAQEAAATSNMTPRSKRRFLDRKKRLERSRTQPITEEELTQASEYAAENGGENKEDNSTAANEEDKEIIDSMDAMENSNAENKLQNAISSDNVSKMDLAEDATIDELSRMSLSEKMKLFSENKASEEAKRDAPVLRRKARRTQSRFKTQENQPITIEEVEKAKISPLAVTMIKPPDPEILQNMNVRDQRTFLAEYAAANFRSSGIFKQSSTEEAPGEEKRKSLGEIPPYTPSTTTNTTTTETVETKTENVESTGTVKTSEQENRQSQSLSESSGTESKSERQSSKKEELRKQRQKQLEQRLQDSSTEDETFDKILRIKNEAIARRRRMMESRKAGESRYHSQPIDPSQIPRSKENGESQKEEKPAKSTSGGGHVRHKTQPITDSEKQKAESQPAGVRSSIHERLAKLKQHGEEDWKKRVRGKDRDIGNIDLSTVKLRDKSKLKSQQQPPTEQQRPKSIADRLSKLENSQASWKDRVEEKDVSQFTVEGKLNRSGKTTTPDSPLLARRKKMRAPLTREEDEGNSESKTPLRRPGRPPPHPSSPGFTPTSSRIQSMHAELSSVLGSTPKRPNSSPLLPLDSSETVSSEMEERPVTKIEVPEPYDEDFQSFFGTQDVTSSEAIDVTVDDFDHIFMESEDMLPSTKKIRPQRKQRTTKNPLKTLAARDDVQSEYTEVRTDIADKELRRIKREQISGSAGFAEEALAGLAHKADFSKVNLRKTDSFGSSTPAGTSGKYEPFKDVMLLHVKGRRHCQVRLVEPTSASLNSGDSFVLVTSDKVYVWIGEYCNIIEKSKATDVAATIQQKRDLGCKSYLEPIVIYEKRQDSPHSKGFWEAIGGKDEYQGPGPVEEDELYEMYMTETNKVWVLDPGAEKLVELDDYRGTVLPYALLNTKAALVFDFGSEFYIWTGKQVPFVTRKMALKLAREQFESGYDYSKFDINPFSPLSTPENGGLPLQAEERPEWALFGKVNENMETILFREKFADWPDSSRLIKVKTDSDDQKTDTPPELEPYDATKMIIVKNTPVDLLLEGSHIGRGQKWVDKTEGITREFEILTLSCQVWHILEYDHSEVEEDSFGQFHDGDTYVVRWHFMVSQAGRTLKGQEARHSVTGRERCAYFFWQGRNSSINEKGASALMTVELDEERGPQVRVIQGKEPPYFIQLFKGRMVTHLGKREDESTNSQGPFRMYIVRNELPREAYLAEITCNISNLRSRGAFLLINVKTGVCYLWIGCKSSAQTRGRARELANNLVNNCPLELGLHPKASVTIKETEEGKENSEFWSALDSSHRSLYFSLLKVPKPCQFTMRLFTMTSVSGIFEASELLNPCRSEEVASPFPFIQSDLYKLDQPSLVMVDAGPEVWVWHGWWPEGTEDSENIKTGSAHARFNTERKLALQTTISYCTEKFGSSGAKDRAFATYAGLEPLSFTNLFPHWSIQNDVTDIQLKEGRHVGERRKIDDLLVQLNRNNYAWSELQQRPLPEGVDPLRLESYLNDDEFLEMLGMSKEEFYKLPPWKQGNLKKTVGLF